MCWTNYHTHCYLCDGQDRPHEYVAEAIKQKLGGLGFSSHAPVPFPATWTLSDDGLATYCRLVQELQQQYAAELPIFLGLEIDYIPDVTSPTAPQFQAIGLDFSIGAIHFVGLDGAGRPWTIDGDADTFAQGLRQGHGGDIRAVVEQYYALVRQMVQTACPDVVAHLDLIKKNNTGGQYFSEEEPWYRAAVFETLETIAASQAILEVNVGGIVRKRTDALYPSPWALERCLALNIPLTLSADAHQPQHITTGFAEAAALLQTIGYKELYFLGREGWQASAFSDNGLG